MLSVPRRSFLLATLTVATGVVVLARFGIIGLLEVAAWPGALAIPKLAPASLFLITFAALETYLPAVPVVAAVESKVGGDDGSHVCRAGLGTTSRPRACAERSRVSVSCP